MTLQLYLPLQKPISKLSIRVLNLLPHLEWGVITLYKYNKVIK